MKTQRMTHPRAAEATLKPKCIFTSLMFLCDSLRINFLISKKWADCLQSSVWSALSTLMLMRKMLQIAHFYSDDISKLEDAVDEFHSFLSLYYKLDIDLNTNAVPPFLIASNMDQAYLHLTVLHRIYITINISSASAKRSFSHLKLICIGAWMRPDCHTSLCCVLSRT